MQASFLGGCFLAFFRISVRKTKLKSLTCGCASFPDVRVLKPRIQFGALIDFTASAGQIFSPAAPVMLRSLWRRHGGLLVIRGLTSITSDQFLALSSAFGEVEQTLDDSKRSCEVKTDAGIPGTVMRIGNAHNPEGHLISMNAISEPLPPNGDPRYDISTKNPVWHTDSTYRTQPPIGSLLYCKQGPPAGAATCFADMAAAYEELPDEQKERTMEVECVCSLAHHDAKVSVGCKKRKNEVSAAEMPVSQTLHNCCTHVAPIFRTGA